MIARRCLLIIVICALLVPCPVAAASKSRWDEPCTKNSPAFDPELSTTDTKLLVKAPAQFDRNPNDQDLFFAAGMCYFQAKNYPALEKLAVRVNKQHPDWGAPYYFLARVADANLEDETVLANYKKAYELKPCWKMVLIVYADQLQLAGRSKEALEVVNTGLSVCDHSDPRMTLLLRHILLLDKGRIYLATKHPELAIKPLEQAESIIAPLYAGIDRDMLANAYMQTKQWKKAIAIATKRCNTEKLNSLGYLVRAHAYYGDGQLQKAQEDITTFLSHLPKAGMDRDAKLAQIKEAHMLNADIFDRLGKKELAKKERMLAGQGTMEIYKNTPFRSSEPRK